VQGTPTSLGPLHRHLAAQWAFKLHTAASIRTGVPQVHLDFAQAAPEVVEAFLRRINVSTGAAGQELGARYDFTATRTLVDVGGGAGGMAVTLAQAYPQLRATVVDLPAVTPITSKLVAEAGATARVTVRAADVVRSPVPWTYAACVSLHVGDHGQETGTNRSHAVSSSPGTYALWRRRLMGDTPSRD
jgi:hypothetical protein